MLSFYQMDRLVRKNRARQRYYESDEISSGASLFAQRLAELKARRAQGAAQPPAPAPAKPVQVAPPEDPLASAEPDIEDAPTTAAPPPATAGGARSGAELRDAFRQRQQASRRNVSGTGPTSAPVRITQGHAPEDPSSPEAMERKAKGDIGHGRGAGRTIGGQGKSRIQKQQETLEMWNNMMRGTLLGSEKSGDLRRESSWAGMLQKVLMGDYNMMLQELGIRGAKFNVNFGDLKVGQPWQVAFTKGGSGQNNLPEFVIDPRTLGQAIRGVWALVGNDRTESGGEPGADNRKASFVGSFLPDFDRAKPGSHEQAVVLRAIQFQSKMWDSRANLIGQTMTVAQLAHRLGELFNNPERQIAQFGKPFGNTATPDVSQAGLHGAIHQKIRGHEDDPQLDLDAMMMLCHKAKFGNKGAITVGQTEFGQSGAFPFLRVQGPKVTPDSVVTIVPLDELKAGDEELHGHVADGGTMGGEEEDAMSMRSDYLARKRAEQQARRRASQPRPDTMGLESAQWMDIYSLMEHWGF